MPVMRHRKKGEEFLRNYIQDRLDGKLDQFGQNPTDLVQRLIDAAPPIEKTVPQLAERVMALNVASIHTTTMVGHIRVIPIDLLRKLTRASVVCRPSPAPCTV